MKPLNFILVVGILCLYGVSVAVGASGSSLKAVDFSAVQWVTQNPPTGEELASTVRVVEFWATWCQPCIKQVSHIKSLVNEYEDRNVIFIGISVDQSISDVRKFVKKKNITYHIGMDNGLSDCLNVSGIPKAFIISHEEKILWAGNPSDKQFEETLKSAVNAAPKAMLAGVDLGPFSHLRIKLCGGRNFAEAYSELESCAKDRDCSEKICACKVLGIVNKKLREKIADAQHMRDKDPQVALPMYKEIIDKYDGINLTREIESTYHQLQKEIAAQMSEAIPLQAKAD